MKKELSLSLRDLRTRYKQHEIACALQCAGLRRHTMRTFLKEVSGIDWGDGAVMNCTWKGPKLKDILNEAGIDLIIEETGHVAFACYYTKVQEDDWYGGSISLSRAMRDDADVILALEVRLIRGRHVHFCSLAVDEWQTLEREPWISSPGNSARRGGMSLSEVASEDYCARRRVRQLLPEI